MGLTKTAGRLFFDIHVKNVWFWVFKKDEKLRRWIIILTSIFILHPDVLQLEKDWNRESCYK